MTNDTPLDGGFVEPISLPACFGCKHYTPDVAGVSKCLAFPDGIPRGILLLGFDHTKPFRGDHGIRFEPKDEPQDDQPQPPME